MKYLFTVWLRDLSLPADDPEFEWPACLVIEGASESSAQAWGDHLSQRYARTSDQTVVRSTTEVLETYAWTRRASSCSGRGGIDR